MIIYEEGITRRLTWNREDKEDVKKAMEFFTNITKQGWLAVKKGDGYERILEFKSQDGEICFIPIVEGGSNHKPQDPPSTWRA
jgi:hypothetical protein